MIPPGASRGREAGAGESSTAAAVAPGAGSPVPGPAAPSREHAPSAAASPPRTEAEPPAVSSTLPRRVTGQAARIATVLLAVLAGGFVLSIGREVFFPIVAAALLSMLLSPIVAQIERLRLPRVFASLLVIIAVIGLLFLAIDALLEPLARALDQVPAMEGLVRRTLRVARYTMGAPFAEWLQARFEDWSAAGKGAASAALFSRFLSVSVGTATVLILAFFLLASGDLFLQKLVRVIPRIRDKVNALKIVRTVQEEVSRYLLTVTMINAVLGLVVGGVCWYFGLPNAILWGTMVGVLNFLPYLGPFVSLMLLTTASAAHFSGLADILFIPMAFSAITIVEGQFLTPMIVGRRVELNPVVVFVGLLLWFWLWGVPGMIVAIPLLIVAKVWAQHTESMAGWAEFLGP